MFLKFSNVQRAVFTTKQVLNWSFLKNFAKTCHGRCHSICQTFYFDVFSSDDNFGCLLSAGRLCFGFCFALTFKINSFSINFIKPLLILHFFRSQTLPEHSPSPTTVQTKTLVEREQAVVVLVLERSLSF